jgi:glycosyltransferase involved in cell wall biosynthesis
MTLDAVYVSYWSLMDPLFQSQGLPVVRDQVRRGRRMALVTYEQPPWSLDRRTLREQRAALESEGILWRPLRYHRRPRVLATLYDVARGVISCVRLARRHDVRLFHSRASVPGAIGYWASRLTGARFFNDADGPLSEEYVDAGLWRRSSVGHRLARWSEETCLVAAEAVGVLSEQRRREIAGRTRSPVTVLPCGVDTSRFRPWAEAGARLRHELDLGGTVFVYAGKAGGWYLTEPMLDFVKAASEKFETSLLVLTTEDPDRFAGPASRRGLRFALRRASREEMPAYLSAGHVGLSFRVVAPSQRASSPIKNGEYLACGLPLVTTPGAGDYSDLVCHRRVGVVVDRQDAEGYRRAASQLQALLAEPGLALRCRSVAASEVGLEEVVLPRYARIYDDLLGPAERRG